MTKNFVPREDNNGQTLGTPSKKWSAVYSESYVLGDGETVESKLLKTNIPTGMIIPFAGNGDLPVGFLLCNGASVSKITYPDLFEVIGYSYGGSGDYFKLPDLVDKFIEGASLGGVYKAAGLPNITGETDTASDNNFFDGASGAFYPISQGSRKVPNSTSSSYNAYKEVGFDASRSNGIYGNSDTVQPPALTMRYIIKAFAGASSSSTDVAITNVANDLNALSASVSAEQGDGYIRYANGLQMCWGNFWIPIGTGASSGGFDGPDFPRPFLSKPILTVSPDGAYGEYLQVHTQSTTATTIYGWYKMNTSSHDTETGLNYIAIGRWK